MTYLSPGWRSPLIAHVSCFLDLSDTETAALASLETPSARVAAGRRLQEESELFATAYILQDGWAIRHKDLSDGRR